MAPKYPKIFGSFSLLILSGHVHRRHIAGYELIQQISGGIFSSVFRVFNIEKHQMTACTTILRSRLPRRNATPYEAEPIDVWGIGIILFTLLPSNPSSPIHFNKLFKLSFPYDTPWDKFTAQLSEFCQYIMGEIFDEPPWNRLETEAHVSTTIPECKGAIFQIFAYSSVNYVVQVMEKGQTSFSIPAGVKTQISNVVRPKVMSFFVKCATESSQISLELHTAVI
jgi:hypothetical protein